MDFEEGGSGKPHSVPGEKLLSGENPTDGYSGCGHFPLNKQYRCRIKMKGKESDGGDFLIVKVLYER